MQILNLVNLDESGIKYQLSRFPDGEVQITLGNFNHKDFIKVKCRITNSEELFVVLQVLDILDRHEVSYELDVYYLMGMRMDRVMSFNRPFTLKIILKMLDAYNIECLNILEPHSEVIYKPRVYLKEVRSIVPPKEVIDWDYQIVLPDEGAIERYNESYYIENFISCSKVRDINTGKILKIKINNPEDLDGRPLMIVDDLCDRGETFCGIAKELMKLGVPKDKLNISVTHMVNSEGIKNLSENFNHVWFTNSYKDWDNLPNNVTMFKVI